MTEVRTVSGILLSGDVSCYSIVDDFYRRKSNRVIGSIKVSPLKRYKFLRDHLKACMEELHYEKN